MEGNLAVLTILVDRNKVKDRPLDVLIYASKHGYTEIADKSAPLTLSVESKDIVAKARSAHIHDSFLVKWFRYREIHDNIYRMVITFECGRHLDLDSPKLDYCTRFKGFKDQILSAILELGFLRIEELVKIIHVGRQPLIERFCSACRHQVNETEDKLKAALAEVPLFSKM
ncbi:hypothetical protein BDN70DRAFT_130151 [Pholiota conissans]|uniref:Uncharacterized protein n=1 Tax=Pholiota conissans TaxID=109636 RepID=A0A9P5YZW6_9AGAR|nr:hypothetical protein BDN70DRAFT_130151 [Pholiota conissans]